MVLFRSLSDSKSPQDSRILLSILEVLSNAVIWIIATSPPTFKSSRPFINPLVIVPKAPITFGTIVTFMFHSFFNSLARSMYLSFFSHSFSFILWSAGTSKSTILQILYFFFVDYYKVLSSGPIGVFMRVIFQDRCWVVHIPFVGMVKFKISCTFPSRSPCPPNRV